MNLNIKVDKVTRGEAIKKAGEFLSAPGQYKIFTPNPEMYVLAQEDKYFREVLNGGDLNICDGTGLSWAYGTERIPGADFMLDLGLLAARKKKKVFLLGTGDDAVAERAAENLRQKIFDLLVAGSAGGERIEIDGEMIKYDAVKNNALIKKINDSGAEILFVGFGMNKQEKWLTENLAKMPSVKIGIGVGGALDFLSGQVRRAPCFVRQFGLEWLYRLIQEPRRIKRIWTATTMFLWKILCGRS